MSKIGEETLRFTAPTTPKDQVLFLGSAVSAAALAWLLVSKILPLPGPVPFAITFLVLLMVIYGLVVQQAENSLAAVDRLMTLVIALGAGIVMLPLVMIIWFVVSKGAHILNWNFFVQDLSHVGALDAGGGLAMAIVGTLEQIGIAVVLAVPLGMMTAVFLNEVKGPLRRPVRMFVDAMSGVPSIVAGLFIYAIFIQPIAKQGSGFAAALALSILMLPTIARTSEEVLRLVPDGLREASLGMGATQWRTVLTVVLPTARNGLITAVVLGVARVVGETAPLIMTALGNTSMNADPLHGPQDALPLRVYTLLRAGNVTQNERAYGGAFVLIFLVLALFSIARILGSRAAGSKTLSLPRFKRSK